jgi:hypothetical protein
MLTPDRDRLIRHGSVHPRRACRRAWAAAMVAVTLSGQALADHHLNGTWKLNVTLGDGLGGVATFELLEAADGTLSGSYSGAAGAAPVQGEVSGSAVTFSFESPAAGTVSYDGTFHDGRLSGTCDYGLAGKGTFEGARVDGEQP